MMYWKDKTFLYIITTIGLTWPAILDKGLPLSTP